MPMYRARAIGAVGVLAAGLLLAGCAPSSGQGAGDDGKPVTLRMLSNITPVLTVEYYEDLVAPFVKSHPGLTVKIEVPSGKDVQTTLQQELASGDIPDIVARAVDPVVAPQLTAFPEVDWVKNTPLVDELRVDGKVINVGVGVQVQSLVYYNKDAFAAAGITKLPQSLKEFTAVMEKLKAAGNLPLQTSGEWTTAPQFTLAANPDLLKNDGDWFAQRKANKVTFAGSAWEPYLETYQSWIKDGYVPADALGVKYPDGIAAFASGAAAMYMMPSFVIPSIEAAKPAFDVGVFPTPTLDGSVPKQTSAIAQGYSILKGSTHQKIAMDLVKYLVTDKEAIAKALKSESNFRQGVSYDASPLTEAVGKIVDETPGFVIGTPNVDTPPGFADELDKQVQTLYTSDTNAKSIMKALDAWWDANATQ